ncbi:MAG: hypothetical protein ICV65_10800 [Flavisolibacter sp.]|nr:hypothetical protein [Flavisolibacter sp.]
MSLLLRKGRLLWLLAVLLFASCTKEFSYEDSTGNNATTVNKPPVANAGADQTITLPINEINLDGSHSTDPNNNITSYAWTKISGPSSVTIANTNAVQTRVTGFVQGIYQFELKVTDAGGLFSKDTAVITVNANEVNAHWTKLQQVPENEFFFGSNHINFLIGIQDKLFAVSKIGGFWQYNPQSNTWAKKGDLPSYMASSNFSVVFSIDNIGYIIGNGTCRQYNVVTNQWTTKNNAPVGANHVDYSVPLIIGNKAYLVGSTNNLVTVYDPSTDSYTLKTRFPDVGAATGFVLNGAGYCIQQNGRCWKYDPVTDSWQQKASLPSSVYNMSGFSLNGYGYIIGDLNRTAYNGNGRMKLWRYDPSLDQWKQLDEDYPGQGVYEIRTVSLNGIVYVGLGYNNGNHDAIDFWSFK